jgi:hypothetical protein
MPEKAMVSHRKEWKSQKKKLIDEPRPNKLEKSREEATIRFSKIEQKSEFAPNQLNMKCQNESSVINRSDSCEINSFIIKT